VVGKYQLHELFSVECDVSTIMNGALGRISDETAVADYKILTRISPARTEES
jgi:hypothetical protein